jgi:hypothetical protein
MFNASPGRYCTRDVISDPPTSVMIVREIVNCNTPTGDVYSIDESEVEVTEGWETRFGKSQLSICFMHSFGKCSGRCNNNPATCHQIHLRREALDALRATYRNRTRTLFSRTIKAHLSDDMRQALSRIARKDLTLKYLEYRASDVDVTEGLQSYETAYRAWLQSPTGTPDLFHDTCVFQCATFATTGSCNAAERCRHIHGDVRNAQVRDHMVANALRQLALFSNGSTNLPSNPPPPPPFHAVYPGVQMAQPFPTPQQPVYVILMPPQHNPSVPMEMQSGPHFALPPQQLQMVQHQHLFPYNVPQHQFIPLPAQALPLQYASKSLSPTDRSPASMTPDRKTESSETFTSGNLWGEDMSISSRQPGSTDADIFQNFRNLAIGNAIVSPRTDM